MGLAEVQTLGALLAKSGYFQDAKDAAQACVKVLAGQELGLPPIASMMGIHVIKGKVELSANLIASLVRRHGYDYSIERHDNTGCVIVFLSKEKKQLGKSSFTEADAKAAQIGSDMYRKFPRNMYFSRAMSNGAKWFCPEVFSGVPVYGQGELGGPSEDSEVVDPAEAGPAPAPVPARGNWNNAPADPVLDQKLAAAKPAPAPLPDIEPRLAELYAQATGFAETVQIITGFKSIINELVGSEADYYRIINSHGMAHGNELAGKTKRQIKQVIRELYEYCTQIASPPPPAEAQEDPAWAALAEGTDNV
jgi:hypothetical protein